MTLKEASERFCISMERLTYYEENKLIMCKTLVDGVPDYSEEELHKVSMIHDLLEAGMRVDVLQKYLKLLRKKTAGKEEQIRILRKRNREWSECRYLRDYSLCNLRRGNESMGEKCVVVERRKNNGKDYTDGGKDRTWKFCT